VITARTRTSGAAEPSVPPTRAFDHDFEETVIAISSLGSCSTFYPNYIFPKLMLTNGTKTIIHRRACKYKEEVHGTA
jgi:hypothetical protein